MIRAGFYLRVLLTHSVDAADALCEGARSDITNAE